MVDQYVESGSKCICAGLLVFQGIMMNVYLAKLFCPLWWSWTVADVIIIIIWACCLWRVKKSFKKKHKDDDPDSLETYHEIKYIYVVWLVYISLLVPRIILIFHDPAKTLHEAEFLGPNFLKMAVSCTPIIYYLLVCGSHRCESRIPRHLAVKGLAITGALDLFDSIELLEFLLLPEEGVDVPPTYLQVTLGFACVSMFLPSLTLYGLHFKTKPGRVSSLTFKVCHELLNLLVINLPNLIIRSVLWHAYSIDVSVLLMKNVMGIIAGFYEIFEYFGEFRPKACKHCKEWFERHAYVKHKRTCLPAGNELDEVSLTELPSNVCT